jgi:hypothetical protein
MIGCKNKISRKKNKFPVKKVLQQTRLSQQELKLSIEILTDSAAVSMTIFMEEEQNGKV